MCEKIVKNKKILIISNRVLSKVDNNGKTLYSFVKDLPKENISQLYFYGNLPTIPGYNYFQLSDKDVIKGKLFKSKRGRKVNASKILINSNDDFTIEGKYKIKRTNVSLICREIIWKNSWKSPQLDKWLEQVHPDIIFFLAGDSIFAYEICDYIKKRLECDLYTYITDDYVLPRSRENVLAKYRRKKIYEALALCISNSTKLFTISERMCSSYKELFGKESAILVNLTNSLFDKELSGEARQNKRRILVYAGSIYYGRDQTLIRLSEAISKFNKTCVADSKKAELYIYSNWEPKQFFLEKITDTGAAHFKGSLNTEELKEKLNKADILVFVESFDQIEAEKVRLSFSTKITEYLSLRKPIIALGAVNSGSMDYFKDAALCIYSEKDIENSLFKLLKSEDIMKEYSDNSAKKYKQLCETYCKVNIFE